MLAGAVLALHCACGAALAASSEAARVVETFHAKLIAVMQAAGALGFDGRMRELSPAVAATFNFPLMARLSVGPEWQRFTPEQQQQFVDLFGKYSAATYAGRFDGFNGERFETLGEKPQQGGSIVVETKLVMPTGEPVKLAYLAARNGAAWQIVDVFVNGTISELAVRRSEYTAILRREGPSGLIATLTRKIDELQSKS
ncbi:MAG: ABC transporter substrate-binding protein [Proteobacteria bacterium]|nr:ABC transporter substrate-binding protein [Pseudomonadota bacterium]MBI3499073.1 ABC transporter substrate-binding protein [Pseudomonadota bacterium]